MIQLTKAEEQVMQVLWKLEKGFVKDILNELPEPKPAYNTVSTIVRILQKKEVVGHESYGKSHQYFPLISMEEYRKHSLNTVVENYFDGSASSLMSFFVQKENLSTKELDEILSIIENHKSKKS